MKILSAIMLSFCFIAWANAADTSAVTNSNTTYENSGKFVPKTDQEITTKLQDAIKPGLFSKGYDEVTFTVNNGMVTLEGMVPTISDKNKFEKQVREMDGVRSLTSHLVSKDANAPASN